MVIPDKALFWLFSAGGVAAAGERALVYARAPSLAVMPVERPVALGLFLAMALFTVLAWFRQRWALAPAAAAHVAFIGWYGFSVWMTYWTGAYLCPHCLVVLTAWLVPILLGLVALMAWGGRHCRREWITDTHHPHPVPLP